MSSTRRWMTGATMWLGGSPGKLDDVLAQVGLHDLHPGTAQRLVEMHLLGRHGLGLDNLLHVGLARNFDDDAL
jgi:hypothetical protein